MHTIFKQIEIPTVNQKKKWMGERGALGGEVQLKVKSILPIKIQ